MNKTEQNVLRFIDEKKLIEKGDNVLVALSGGPDSVFLLHFLVHFRKRLDIKIGAIHINHMIRGKAAREDEAFCSDLCLYLDVDLRIVRKNVRQFAGKNKISLEEAGRIIRYREFNRECKRSGYNKIATAHNCSDNAETVLLNLIKGTGLKGISGIPVSRGIIIRPILGLTKEEIYKYLNEKNISYRTDLSNQSNEYERNLLRNKIIPVIKENLNPNIERTVFNSSGVFTEISRLFEEASGSLTDNLFSVLKYELRLSLKALNDANKAVSSFALKLQIERNFSVKAEFNDIKKILSLKDKQAGRTVELSNKLSAIKEREYIVIRRKTKNQADKTIRLKEGESVAVDGAKLKIKNIEGSFEGYSGSRKKEYISGDSIKGNFLLRRWKNGDKFFPLGLGGSKKISDFLNEQRIPSSKKRDQLVLTNENKIVWVVGLRLDDRYKITKQTKKVFELCLT